jgi:hypothetical protein
MCKETVPYDVYNGDYLLDESLIEIASEHGGQLIDASVEDGVRSLTFKFKSNTKRRTARYALIHCVAWADGYNAGYADGSQEIRTEAIDFLMAGLGE